MTDMKGEIRKLRQDVLALAGELLDHDIRGYRALSHVAERLTVIMQEDGGAQSNAGDSQPTSDAPKPVGDAAVSPSIVKIHAKYKGVSYEAKLDTSRINYKGRGNCVCYKGQWMSASAAAMKVKPSQTNGWRFWRYRRDNGMEALIEELKP